MPAHPAPARSRNGYKAETSNTEAAFEGQLSIDSATERSFRFFNDLFSFRGRIEPTVHLSQQPPTRPFGFAGTAADCICSKAGS